MPQRLTPTIILANYVNEDPALDRQLRAGVRRATTPAEAARWLKQRIRFLIRPGRALATFHSSARRQGMRIHHIDWRDLVGRLSTLSAHEFIDLLLRGEVIARRAYVIQRYELVPRGTPKDDGAEAYGFVSINTEDGTLWEDGQLYVADVDDTQIDIDTDAHIDDRRALYDAIENACAAAEG